MSDNKPVLVKTRLMKRKRRSTYPQRKRIVQKNEKSLDNLELDQVNPQMNDDTLPTVTNTSCQSVNDILSTSDFDQSDIVSTSSVATQSEVVSSSDVNQTELVATSVVVTQNESEIVSTIDSDIVMIHSVVVNSETVTSIDPGPSTSTSVTAVNVSTDTGESTATVSQAEPISGPTNVPETDSTDGGAIPNSVDEKEKMTKDCDKKDEDCPVCLQTCMHPARLPCGHIFCFLCLKGLACSGQLCPMCRAPIPHRYAYHPELLPHTSNASSTSPSPQPSNVTTERFRWYYEGRKGGWWQFEQRMSDEIEENHNTGVRLFDMMICGQLYVIDTTMNIQHPKYMPGRVRRILRELPSRIRKKGVAGIQGVY